MGPVFEDLLAADSISVKVRNRVKKRQVKNAVEAFNHWTNEQRDIIVGLGNSLEHAEITPVQALDELDRIAAESRARLVRLIEAALGTDTSMIGRRRYKRWRNGAGEKLRTNETRYLGAYRIVGVTYTYNPGQAIRLTANGAGIDLKGSAAHSAALFTAFGAQLYVPPGYLHRYLVWDGTSRYGSSRANYLTSAANVGPCTSTR